MRLFTFIVLIATGCQSLPVTPDPGLGKDQLPAVTIDCRRAEPEPTGQGVQLILGGIARAQTNDLRCGPPSDSIRICRALFVISTLDPAQHLDDPLQFQRTRDATQWALGDALLVSPPELSPALHAVREATEVLGRADRDDERIEALVARAEPSVTEPLDAHWVAQCQ